MSLAVHRRVTLGKFGEHSRSWSCPSLRLEQCLRFSRVLQTSHHVPNFFSSQVEIFADTIRGYLNILTNGGNGNQGQDGREGQKGADRGYQV